MEFAAFLDQLWLARIPLLKGLGVTISISFFAILVGTLLGIVGELTRGALQSIPRGQTEAAKAIGLTFSQTFFYVLGPQALRSALPAWVNTAAEMVKASTLLSIIGVAELLLRTQELISRTFMSLEFYFFAGFLYFVINYGIERFGRYVERKVTVAS
jgi:polar amino acid transport system permease protein